jgi:hypothetical protein
VAVADSEDLHILRFDVIQDAVNAAALAVEKLADAPSPKPRLRGQGATVRKLGEAFDSVAEAVEPF